MFDKYSQIPDSLDGTFLKKPARRCVLEFGFLLGGVAGLIGLYVAFWNANLTGGLAWIGAGLVFSLAGWQVPGALFHPWRLWMVLALILNKIMTPLLLGVMWYGVVTPTGILLRLMGKDILDTKLDQSADSYYVELSEKHNSFEHLSRQF